MNIFICLLNSWDQSNRENQSSCKDNDYNYEDLSDADDHERRVIWEYTRLGLLPESEYDKSILEEYLKKE
ncbi:immunity protein YezG family protein [Peribacillus simplex]|uniref:immunity protein YezG family protein n=1 Tax=Peribacillus simplex TaxID=1478 RepID=UPI0036713110